MLLEKLAPVAVRLAIIIELCTLSATIWGWSMLREHALREDQAHFEALVKEADHALASRLQNYEAALWGGVGMVQAAGNWRHEGRRAEWLAYVDTLDLDRRFPGMLGMGYIQRVGPEDETTYVAAERRDGFPSFAIHPVPGGRVQARDKLPISYVVPAERNFKAIGLDIGSESNRRAAAERAWTTGEATITGIIQLVQDAKQTAGFLLLVPVRQLAEDADDLWVYAPIIGDHVCQGVVKRYQPELSFSVYDQEISERHLIARQHHEDVDEAVALTLEREHVYAGRSWQVVWRATTNFKSTGQTSSNAMLAVGLLFSLALMVVLYTVRRSYDSALDRAASTEQTLLTTLQSAGLGIWEFERSSGRMTGSGPLFDNLGPNLRQARDKQSVLEGVHPEDRTRFARWLDARKEDKGYNQELQVRFEREDHGHMWALCAGSPDPANPDILRGTLVDISGLIYVQERLQRSERSARGAQETAEAAQADAVRAREHAERLAQAKSEFLATMSHELRTPLNSILGFSQRLARTAELDERQAAGLEAVQRNGRHLLELINSLLDMSKVEAGQLDLELQPVLLGTLLDQITAGVEPLASEKQLELAVVLPEVEVEAQCDALRIQQIVTNLLSNAIKYTDTGSVTVSLRTEARDGEDCAVIEVRDTGIGISEEDQQRLFQKFQQLAPSQTRKIGGTGLGLALSNELAQLHGGHIEVRSRPGEGSVFALHLPLSPSPALV